MILVEWKRTYLELGRGTESGFFPASRFGLELVLIFLLILLAPLLAKKEQLKWALNLRSGVQVDDADERRGSPNTKIGNVLEVGWRARMGSIYQEDRRGPNPWNIELAWLDGALFFN